MTNDHTANGFFDQADQDCIWGHELDLIAEAELELAAHNFPEGSEDSHMTPEMLVCARKLTALDDERKGNTYDVSDLYPEGDDAREMGEAISEAIALANAGYKPEHDHAPGQGDIFSCPACIANSEC